MGLKRDGCSAWAYLCSNPIALVKAMEAQSLFNTFGPVLYIFHLQVLVPTTVQ